MKIRVATTNDLPELCKLLGFLFEQEAEFTPDVEMQQRGLSMILDNPDVGRILCCELEEDGPLEHKESKIVGMVNLLFTVSTALGERVAILEDLVVAPHMRSQGIGKALLNEAVRHANANKIKRITLLTDPDNTKAQALYTNAGFEKSQMLTMRRTL